MYYEDIITMIEDNIYMSPSQYMLARNISSFFNALDFCKNLLDRWYDIMKNKSKKREVLLHNNLDLSHVVNDKNLNFLISFDKSKRGIPIYDFIDLYNKYYDKYDFVSLYREYTLKFPLFEEEKLLMYINLFIPKKILFDKNEMTSLINVSKLCNYLYITNNLFMEEQAKKSKIQDHQINE